MEAETTPRPNHVESNLPTGIREALQEMEGLLGIPRGRWPEVASLRVVVETVAVVQVARELREEEDQITETQAVQVAANLMGMSPEAVARRIRRWRSADTTSGHNVRSP
jgi:hypothetical protein